MLEGEERYETREAIVAAFYDFCRGDPASYPVQYALVQKAMVIGLLLGSIVAGLSFHVVTLNWPPR